jgi:urease accessory protein
MNAVALPEVVAASAGAGWHARLRLAFERRGPRTVIARRDHVGPLRVQKALYPEGDEVCEAIVVHPPGGIVGGDRLELEVDVGAGAWAQITTPGAAKWYRSAGDPASLATRLAVGAGATLEWLPQETLAFDGARAAIDTRIELARGARFIGWEIVGLGRSASGERFERGRFCQSIELHDDGGLAWCERAVLDGGSAALQSGAILGGSPVFGTLVVAGAAVDDELLATCRMIGCSSGAIAVTRVPRIFVARYRGDSTGSARTYLAKVWQTLRPALLRRAAEPPRIWST